MTAALRSRARVFSQPLLFGVLVLAALPFLLLSDRLPGWVAAAALLWLIGVFVLRAVGAQRWLGFTPADLPLLLLLAVLTLNLWASPDRTATLPLIYAFVANIALFWALAAQNDARRLRWLAPAVLAASWLLAVALLFGTRFAAGKLPFVAQDFYSLLPSGLQALWGPDGFNSNVSAGVLALFWPPAVALAFAGPQGWQRVFALLTALMLTGLALLTQSRGALVGLALALVVMTSLYERRWRWVWWAAGVVAALLFLLRPDVPLAWLAQGGDASSVSSLAGRAELWNRALAMIQDFSITGVGLGMFEPVMAALYPTFVIDPSVTVHHPHNLFLQTASEMGIPGLIAFLGFVFALAYGLLRQRHRRGQLQVLALGFVGSLTAWLAHGLFDVVTYSPRAAIIVWAVLGAMGAVAAATPTAIGAHADA